MTILVNGKQRTIQAGTTLAQLLDDLRLRPETLVVELNQTIIQPESYSHSSLQEEDCVEIIRFVGGG